MNLVDSSGWIEFFTDGKNAKFFEDAIEDNENLIVSAINIYEVFKKILSERDEHSAKLAIGIMMRGKVIEVDSAIAMKAAIYSNELKLPMADSLIYATSRIHNAIVLTQDSDFKNLEVVKLIKK